MRRGGRGKEEKENLHEHTLGVVLELYRAGERGHISDGRRKRREKTRCKLTESYNLVQCDPIELTMSLSR